MFRFRIRDVLWLTVVVGVALAVWVQQHRQLASERQELAADREYLAIKQREVDRLSRQLRTSWDELHEYADTLKPLPPMSDQLTRIKAESAKLGAPQPKPLPPGYGEKPNAQ